MSNKCADCRFAETATNDLEGLMLVCRMHSNESKSNKLFITKEGCKSWDADFKCDILVADDFCCSEFKPKE